jgi:predicted SAM-dependent methyltransferase
MKQLLKNTIYKYCKNLHSKIKDQWFYDCLSQFKSLDKEHRFLIKEEEFWKCLNDNTTNSGFDTQYEYHQAWAARILSQTNPKKHTNISSRISFNAIVSAFIPIEFYDFRPAKIYLENLECKKADLTDLYFEENSIQSLSCMHAVEHIGLGRYGDEIDPNGDLKAINELKRVLSKGGDLLFVVPVGKPRIQYNAHRIYSYEMILDYFKEFELKDYTLIPDNALEIGLIKNATKEITDKQKYACGCFWFRK